MTEEEEIIRQELLTKLQEVRIAIKTLCFLYPRAGGQSKPKCAGVVLRRFFQRESDLVFFIGGEGVKHEQDDKG